MRQSGFRVAVIALAPVLVLAGVFVAFVRPRMMDARAAEARTDALERRLDELRDRVAGPRTADEGAAELQREAERRIPRGDPVPALIERLMQPTLVGSDGVRNLVVETGDPVPVPPEGTGDEVRDVLPSEPLRYTPIMVSFDAPYALVGRVLWELQTLPSLVEVASLEVRSAEEASAAHVDLTLHALGREAAAEQKSNQGERPTVDVTTPPDWIRNPLVAAEPATVEPAPEPVVTSILYSPQRRAALVDGRIVTVGDRVGGGRVSAIERDAVVLETDDGGERRLELRARSPRQQ